MALPLLLAQSCPGPAAGGSTGDFDAVLLPRRGGPVPCHAALLRARCPALDLGLGSDGSVRVDEDEAVVLGLLRWVYREALDLKDLAESPRSDLGGRVARLAEAWGLRDVAVLRERLVRSWRTARQRGSLAADVLRAYDAGELGSLRFLCDGVPHEAGEEPPCVYGGLPILLRAASSYFRAMLSGSWAESAGCERAPVRVCWPGQQLCRLVRFLHGGPFVSGPGDLPDAVECGDYFGVPALLAHANDWIAGNLEVSNAANLWGFVDREPRLRPHWLRDSAATEHLPWTDLTVDADDACFDFHVREFMALAADPEDGDGSWVPLHDLSLALMLRLVSSGLVAMSTEPMKAAVERFAKAKTGGGADGNALARSLLPPAVLFNRELRDALVCTTAPSIRTLL